MLTLMLFYAFFAFAIQMLLSLAQHAVVLLGIPRHKNLHDRDGRGRRRRRIQQPRRRGWLPLAHNLNLMEPLLLCGANGVKPKPNRRTKSEEGSHCEWLST